MSHVEITSIKRKFTPIFQSYIEKSVKSSHLEYIMGKEENYYGLTACKHIYLILTLMCY